LNWYEEVDINSVKLKTYYDVCASDADVYNDDDEFGEFVPAEDDDTVIVANITNVNKLEDPYEYQLYDSLRAQIDGGAKVSVTNNLDLLTDIRFYNKKFKPKHKMKGATSEVTIKPRAEGYLQVPTIQEGQFLKVKCYYSPQFTSTLLSDNDILEASPFRSEYSGQSMLKFFEPEEID
jgi:hypothetical protein